RCAFLLVSALVLLPRPPLTAIYSLSLHDALPISAAHGEPRVRGPGLRPPRCFGRWDRPASLLRSEKPRYLDLARPLTGRARALLDRKSTRLNSSHVSISYAVFCLKKKKPKSCVDF